MASFFASLTSRGRFFIALGVALVVTGLGLGMRDLTRIGLLLLILPAATLLITRRHPMTFGVARRPVPGRVRVDESSTVELTVVNPSRTRSPVIAAEESLDYSLGDRPRTVIPPLRRGQSHAMSYTVRSHVRGRHRLGPLTLSVSDPFGLTERDLSMQSTADIIVLPRAVPLTDAGRGSHGTGSDGTIPHMVALHGEDDVAVREYRYGDDLRRVHWPATARTGDLMVRQEDRPAMKRAVVLLDSRLSVHGPTTSQSLEWAVTMAASVVLHAMAQNYAVHLVTASPEPGVGRHSTSSATSMEALALVTPGPDEDLIGVLHTAGGVVGDGGLIVAILGSCTDSDARAVASLRSLGSRGLALVIDRSTLTDDPAALKPGHRALGTVETLRRAGWRAVVVGRSTSWQSAWAQLTGSGSMTTVGSSS
ncbi:MAG: DUF58 domain-containing protein [Intrasporangiaceae bacterium]|nr:DUF58 domain-containing protein [Intrasporangiaceae bacterium]